MKHKITFDTTTKRSEKPTNKEIGFISNNLKSSIELTIREFAEMVTQPNGFSWCGATFEGSRKNDNWREQSVFALDFDSGVTPEEIRDLFAKYKIIPNVIYSSFSDTAELRKFRVVFFLNQVVNEAEIAKFINVNLMKLVEQKADKACKDLCRLYFGGRRIVLLADEVNDYEYFMSVLSSVAVAEDKGQTRSLKKVQNLQKNDYSYYNNIEMGGFLQKCENEDSEQLKDFDFEKAIQNVTILREFVHGKWLTHPEIFGLATNMIHIRGGIKFMEEIMEKHNESGLTQYTENNFAALKVAKNNNYAPMKLENFSPYEEDLEHTNIITSTRWERGLVEVISKETLISLETAESLFRDEFDRVINDETEGVFLFKVPTGMGKTAALENLDGVTIALPTHDLKNEVSKRMKVEHITSPAIPEFSDEVKEALEFYYNSGLISYANMYLKDIASEKVKSSLVDSTLAKQYIKKNNDCLSSKKTVLTTHQKATFIDYKHDTLIFDEDALQNFISIKKITLADLNILEDLAELKDEISVVNKFCREMGKNQYIKTPLWNIEYERLAKSIVKTGDKIKNDIISFFDSAYIFKELDDVNTIHYVVKRKLPKAKKIIIMSATASDFMYRKLFGENLQIIDIMNVEQKGEVIQNTRYSYSKSGFDNRIQYLNEEIGDLPVITFANKKSKFKNAVKEMHFGNCSGYDELNGQDIAVVGTFHLNDFVYSLYALALGVELTNRDNIMTYQTIIFNGCKFKFNTYENEALRAIQLSLIEAESIQAIGRNRTLRNACTTKLFSNLPLRQTTKFI
jgi:hypothetical protein